MERDQKTIRVQGEISVKKYINVDHSSVMEHADDKLKAACEKALAEKYGEKPPQLIRERYESELDHIVDNGFASYYILASMLAAKCGELGYLHNLRGCAGGSFIVYLLGISEVNSLPPHTRCPKCGRIEFVDTEEYPSGFDLNRRDMERKLCPVCGGELVGDGHNIPVEFFAGYDGGKKPTFTFNFATEIQKDMIRYLEELNGKDINVLPHSMFAKLKRMEESTGISARSIRLEDVDIFSFFMDDDLKGLPFDGDLVREIADKVFPARFSDLVKILGFAHGKNVWIGNGETLAGTVCYPENVIAHRDDVMLTLIKHGIDRETAFDMAEMVRKGEAESYFAGEREAMLIEHGVPEWYTESMKKIKYLFPKAHSTEYAINTLRMIWYKIHYPEAFFAAVADVDGRLL